MLNKAFDEEIYCSPCWACIYLIPWVDTLLFHWHFLGIGAALFALWNVKAALRWNAALAWGFVGWSWFCFWRDWHPLPGDWMVAMFGYIFCAWIHAYVDGQDRKKSPEPQEEF